LVNGLRIEKNSILLNIIMKMLVSRNHLRHNETKIQVAIFDPGIGSEKQILAQPSFAKLAWQTNYPGIVPSTVGDDNHCTIYTAEIGSGSH
jgi:hypothetical protein